MLVNRLGTSGASIEPPVVDAPVELPLQRRNHALLGRHISARRGIRLRRDGNRLAGKGILIRSKDDERARASPSAAPTFNDCEAVSTAIYIASSSATAARGSSRMFKLTAA